MLPSASVYANNLKMKKGKDRGITVFDGRLDYTVRAVKTEWLQNELKHTDQPNRTEYPETVPLIHSQLLSTARTKNHDGERRVPLINGTEKTGYIHMHVRAERRKKASRKR